VIEENAVERRHFWH